jgi:hypothetical protein
LSSTFRPLVSAASGDRAARAGAARRCSHRTSGHTSRQAETAWRVSCCTFGVQAIPGLAQNTPANAGLGALVVSAASWQVHNTVSSLALA